MSSTITKEEVEHGERIKNVPDTNKKYYRFVGWYEKGETEKFDLTKEIKKLKIIEKKLKK